MASKQAKELWNQGVPLSRAWLEFAPATLRSKFERLPSLLGALFQVTEMNDDQNPIRRLPDIAKNNATRLRLEKEMKEEVLTDLFNRQLLATAYREYPSRSQNPVVIDPAKFENNDPDWRAETLEAHGIRYGRIRISALGEPDTNQTKPRGSVDAIDDAIDKAMLSNSAFCGLPRKIACQQIRDILDAKEISGNGMSDQNLAKAIVRKCGAKRISAN